MLNAARGSWLTNLYLTEYRNKQGIEIILIQAFECHEVQDKPDENFKRLKI
jgi:hypothetical protein